MAGLSQINLELDDLEDDSLFQSSDESTTSVNTAQTYSALSSQQFPISYERSTAVQLASFIDSRIRRPRSTLQNYLIEEINTDSSDFPYSSDTLQSSFSTVEATTLFHKDDNSVRGSKFRITARRFYERLKSFHLNRSYPSVAFDPLNEYQQDAIFGSPNSSSDNGAEVISPANNPNSQFSFTMGQVVDGSSISSMVGQLQGGAFPIRRDNPGSIGHGIHISRSFRYFGSLLRRSASLRSRPPVFGDDSLGAPVLEGSSERAGQPLQQTESADFSIQQSPEQIMAFYHQQSGTYSFIEQMQYASEMEEPPREVQSSPISRTDLLITSSMGTSPISVAAPPSNPIVYISPVAFLIDELLSSRNLDRLVFYFNR